MDEETNEHENKNFFEVNRIYVYDKFINTGYERFLTIKFDKIIDAMDTIAVLLFFT